MSKTAKQSPSEKSQDPEKSKGVTSQDSGSEYKVGPGHPPKERQFGQPNGNPRGHGFFKVEDTPRAKLEKIITLTDEELEKIIANKASSTFEKTLASTLLDNTLKSAEKWKIAREMIDEVYGYPKQSVAAEVAEVKPLIDLRKRKRNGDAKA